MEITKARIGKRTVDAVAVPAGSEARLWDSEIKGFFLRVYPSGRRVYALKYRAGRQQRILTLGTHGSPMTADRAREAALEALDRVRRGEDPATDKRAARDALTVAALIDAYLKDGPITKPAKRATTWAIDTSNLNSHIRPLLGRKIANALTKADAARAIRDIATGKTAATVKTGSRGLARISGGEGTARRTRITAAAMFAWGIEHGLVALNPFAGVKLTAAPVRERFLSRAEAVQFLEALSSLEKDGGIADGFADALRLLLLTGARKSEVLGLRWGEVDFERQRLVLPPERTKAGGQLGERRVTLSPPALEILARRKRKEAASDTFVFPASRGDGHAVGLRRAFVKACARARLTGLRVHDLRHSFASFAIADGASLFLVSKLLGHASGRTTERYAHLASDPLQDVANRVGKVLGATPNSHDGVDAKRAEIVPIRGALT